MNAYSGDAVQNAQHEGGPSSAHSKDGLKTTAEPCQDDPDPSARQGGAGRLAPDRPRWREFVRFPPDMETLA